MIKKLAAPVAVGMMFLGALAAIVRLPVPLLIGILVVAAACGVVYTLEAVREIRQHRHD